MRSVHLTSCVRLYLPFPTVNELLSNELDASSILGKLHMYAPANFDRVIYTTPYLDAHFI